MGVIGKTLRFTLGLALGAGIGAVGALLVAPQPGSETQATIRERVDQLIQVAKQAQEQRERELQEYWEQEAHIKKIEAQKEGQNK
jgi:gas vesicle protein